MIKKSVKYFNSDVSDSFEQEVNNCLEKILNYLRDNTLSDKNIFSISIFIRTEDNYDFSRKKQIFNKIALKYFDNPPPLIFIAQAPYQSNIACELIIGVGQFNVSDKIFNKINYRIIEFNEYFGLYSSSIDSEINSDSFKNNSNLIFQKIKNLLKNENLNFNNIIRQWNYIENILEFENGLQNYQALNDIRTDFYSKVKWLYGYPAATGIGMNSGSIAINFIAVQKNEGMKIFPIHSPIQSDAHKYSEKVLISNKNTPKFERGKIVFYNNNFDFYISGTAAIEGEDTFESIDIIKQTEFTFENIKSLTSKDNLNNNLLQEFANRINNEINIKDFSNFRIYVKRESDIAEVKRISQNYIANVPTIYLKADICREDLLVEIECGIFQ